MKNLQVSLNVFLNQIVFHRWWITTTLTLMILQFVAFQAPSELSQQKIKTELDSRKRFDVSNDNSILIENYPIRGPLPWDVLNEELKKAFTLGGQIRLEFRYIFDNTENPTPGVPIVYSNIKYTWQKSEILRMVEIVKQGGNISTYGGRADKTFHNTLKKYSIKGMKVLVVGSQYPWVESYCLAYGAKRVTTVDFNVPIIEDQSLIRGVSIAELAESNEKFDSIFSYSSLEHDGLGRYGDPLNPNGDIERLKRIMYLLLPTGKLFLGVPMGNDTLVWNAHRIYGRIRFAKLIEDWKLVESIGHFDFDHYDVAGADQPINVLELV